MAEITHFERLGLPLDFALDVAALERHYLERSRAVHPDHTGERLNGCRNPAQISPSTNLRLR